MWALVPVYPKTTVKYNTLEGCFGWMALLMVSIKNSLGSSGGTGLLASVPKLVSWYISSNMLVGMVAIVLVVI